MCDHQSQIEDVRQGDLVCGDCGLVLDKIYLHEPIKTNFCSEKYLQNEGNINSQQTNAINRRDLFYTGDDLLITLFDKLHLSENTRNSILQFWEKIKRWRFERKKKHKLSLEGLVVMAVYEGLIQEKIPRPMSHLCQDAGLKPKTVWRLIKLYKQDNLSSCKISTKVFKTSNMLEYFLQPLHLNFLELESIKQKVKNYKNYSYAPKTLAAACAYVFLKETRSTPISIKNTANILGVSVMSLYRCYKKLKQSPNK